VEVGKNTKSAAEGTSNSNNSQGKTWGLNYKRKHRAILYYSMFSGGEKSSVLGCFGYRQQSIPTLTSYFCLLLIYLIVRCRFAKVQYEHTEGRMDTRAGFYGRRFQTKAGLVNIKVPRLCKATLETVIIEHYRRRESSVEEALIQMCPAGASVL
jgi:hypothetical protein